MGLKTFFLLCFLARAQQNRLDLNPQPWDDEESVLPLCSCHCPALTNLLTNNIFSILISPTNKTEIKPNYILRHGQYWHLGHGLHWLLGHGQHWHLSQPGANVITNRIIKILHHLPFRVKMLQKITVVLETAIFLN